MQKNELAAAASRGGSEAEKQYPSPEIMKNSYKSASIMEK